MNTERFDGKGDVYAFARPSYPAALFDYLTEKQIISEKTVAADIGAGTGIFSAALCPYVKKVLAVEPNSDMRAGCRKKRHYMDKRNGRKHDSCRQKRRHRHRRPSLSLV